MNRGKPFDYPFKTPSILTYKTHTQKLEKPESTYRVGAVRDMLYSKAGGHVPPHHRSWKRLRWALFWPLPLPYSPFPWGATTLSNPPSQSLKNKEKMWGIWGQKWTRIMKCGNKLYKFWVYGSIALEKLYHRCTSLLFNRCSHNFIKGTKLALTTQKKRDGKTWWK